MTRRKIKVVKRDAPRPEPATPAPKLPVDPERGMTKTVNNWITERRKNREDEKTSTDHKIFNQS